MGDENPGSCRIWSYRTAWLSAKAQRHDGNDYRNAEGGAKMLNIGTFGVNGTLGRR